MVFQTPLFLLLLIPCAAIAIWLMRRRGDETAVPFVHLWPDDAPAARRSLQRQRLPGWIVLMLAAVACGIVAAAGLMLGAERERRVNLVIDRGVTMSAIDGSGDAAFESIIKLLSSEAGAGLKAASITVVPHSPAADAAMADGSASTLGTLRRSAVETGQSLEAAIAQQLRTSGLPVVVATARAPEPPNSRVIIVPPPMRRGNAGIVSLAAEQSPAPQVMVRVRSDTRQSVTVTVRSGSELVRRAVQVEAHRVERLFFDLPSLDEIIEVRVEASTDLLAADDRGWLVRTASWPRVEVRGTSPGELARLIELYSQQRTGNDASPVVRVSTAGSEMVGGKERAVFVQTTGEPAGNVSTDSIEILSDLGRGVDWAAALRGASIGAEPDASWQPIVRVAGKTVVAQRSAPARQVLVNFWSPTFPREADFVVLFASIFDSFAGGELRWAAEPMFIPPPSWKPVTPAVEGYEPSPGMYRDETGKLHALNAVDITLPTIEPTDWQPRLAAIPRTPVGGRDLALWWITAAILLTMLALLLRARVNVQPPTVYVQSSG